MNLTVKEQKRLYHAEWCRKNREKVREYKRKWREKNPEYGRSWFAARPGYSREQSRRQYWRNPDKSRKYQRMRSARLRHENPEKYNEAARCYYRHNLEKCKQSARRWKAAHRDEQREAWQRWYAKNIIRCAERSKKYRAEHPTRKMDRYYSDIQFRLRDNLRSRVHIALKKRQKAGSAVRDLGCSIPELVKYLESKFTSGMVWENWGTIWQLDHVIPLSAFDLTDPKQFRRACHFSNLQPLLKTDNLKKSDKVKLQQVSEWILGSV